VSDWQHSTGLDETERLVVEFADAMSRTPVNVDDDLRQRVAARFSPGQVVELSHAVAWEHARARFNRALGIESDGFSDE
jgi:alkylhydroperoxidase family enzyme